MEAIGVSQRSGDSAFLLSSMARDMAAAVNALVVLQVEKRESVVILRLGNSANPYAYKIWFSDL